MLKVKVQVKHRMSAFVIYVCSTCMFVAKKKYIKSSKFQFFY